LDEDEGRGYQLQQSVVKLMRGLLLSMMKQAGKVERFKHTQHPDDALHAKYDTHTGDVVVGDQEWGHLQLDATSLFLLMLAQMTASGLRIVFTLDEVNFVQNLVHYIGRAYRTPDYGIWERGNKINHGITELNASSIGMAKAALEAMDGFNLFGVDGGQSSVVHVMPDEIARARITLEFLLPRESNSKETDAALLSVIGFPAFAVENLELANRTRDTIIAKLGGRHGCKRFLLDGHQTVLEDPGRLHYEPSELKAFEHIESEWPLFFTYLVLDGIFRNDPAQAELYSVMLDKLFVEVDGERLLPELYYVPAELVPQEKQHPYSQQRLPNENVPLVWAQSLYILGALIKDGLLAPSDIDPLDRRSRLGHSRAVRVMVLPLAANESVQAQLAAQGIRSQTLAQAAPMQIRRADELAEAFSRVGANRKLQLTGRPVRRLRSLSTSQLYILRGEKVLFLPQCLDEHNFYLTLDDRLMVERFKAELAYLAHHWDKPGNPLMALLIDEPMLSDESAEQLFHCMRELQSGSCNGIHVRVGVVAELAEIAAKERIDYLHDFELSRDPVVREMPRGSRIRYDPALTRPLDILELPGWQEEGDLGQVCARLSRSCNLYEQIALLSLLWRELGPDADAGVIGYSCSVRQFAEDVYAVAAEVDLWSVIRQAAGLLGLYDETLEDAVVEIVVRQKQLAVGRSYSADAVISKPLGNAEILERIAGFCGDDERERVLNQEIVLYLAMLLKAEPELFEGMLTLRSGHLLQLIIGQLARERNIAQHQALDRLMELKPYALLARLRQVLRGYQDMVNALARVESLSVRGEQGNLTWVRFLAEDDPQGVRDAEGWHEWRDHHGIVSRVDEEFFAGIWSLLDHCKGVVVGERFNPANCLDSALVQGQMTPGEKNFAFLVDHLLNKIQAPDYRHLTIEALAALVAIMQANPSLRLQNYLVLDVLIGYAVRLAWLDMHPEHALIYNEKRSDAWAYFYRCPPHQVGNSVMAALAFLLQDGNGESREIMEQEAQPVVVAALGVLPD
jgi:phosphorylase kinase alpha/beta subunit